MLRAALVEDGGTQGVQDYVWGHSAEVLLSALRDSGGLEGAAPVRFVQIGSASGQTIQLSAVWLRSSGVQTFGSDLGSSSVAGILESMKTMFVAFQKGGFQIETKAVRLKRVVGGGLEQKQRAGADCLHHPELAGLGSLKTREKAQPDAGPALFKD